MATQSAPRRYTYQEFAALPDDGERRELVYGELLVTLSPTGNHQTIVTNGLILFRSALEQPAEGLVLPDIDVVLSADRAVRPDIVVLTATHIERYRKTHIAGAPDLVVEVLSPGAEQHDRVRKWGWYEEFGVLEYWIAAQTSQTVEIHRRLDSARFADSIVLADDDRLETPLIPRLKATVADLYVGLPNPMASNG